MKERKYEFPIIKATSKVTGDIHYVEINSSESIALVKDKSKATFFYDTEEAKAVMEEYCDGEETHTYTLDSIIITLREVPNNN